MESGKVALFAGNLEVMEINLKSQQIDVKVEDKDFVKRAIRLGGEFTKKPGNARNDETETNGERKKLTSSLSQLRAIAETLSRNGITVTLSYRGHTAVTLGSQAHPSLLQLITRTRAVAINNILELMQMLL